MDTLIRLSACDIIDDHHNFVSKFLNGTWINDMEDRDGKKMRDWYLKRKLSSQIPELKNNYKKASGFVHLSHEHHEVMRGKKLESLTKNGAIQFFHLGTERDIGVRDEMYVILIDAFRSVTICIIQYLEKWVNYMQEFIIKHSFQIETQG